MQQHVQAGQPRVAPDFRRQGVAVHGRHLDVGDDHGIALGRVFAGGVDLQQVVQRLFAVREQGGAYAQLVQHAADLLAGHARIVDHQHLQLRGIGRQRHRGVQHGFAAQLGDVRQHAFHVDHLDQLALEAGHRGQVARFGAQLRRRVDVFDGDVDDPLHAAHQEALDRAVELGHHQVPRGLVGVRLALGMADRQAQVQHRYRPAAHVRHAGELAGQARHLEQIRAAQDLLDLEHIHAKKLTSAKAEQQQGKPVVARQAGTLVDAVEQVM